jgi:hypothetical protein
VQGVFVEPESDRELPPIDFQLCLPKSWTLARRRAEARILEIVVFKTTVAGEKD